MRRCLLVALVGLILALPGPVLLCGCGAPGTDSIAEPRAAIIDQLFTIRPNQAFVDEATSVLEGCGFSVDLYQGDEVTVDFFRELPSYGYKLIIFRVHSGELMQEGNSHSQEAVFLFTSEPYSEAKYLGEQMSGQMAKARTSEEQPYVFAVGAKFVISSMKGDFDDSVVLMMGCSAIRYPDMAQAFIKKGASIYSGWSASVGLDYVDAAALNLITNLCTKAMSVEQAIVTTMNEVGPDPNFDANLYSYPPQNANQTIAELIR